MKDERAGDQIVARIGFAETWLDRAKRQVADGNLARGILTLVLADAEVHHAIEVAGTPRPIAASRVPIAVPVLLLVLVAASAFGLTRSSADPALPPDAGAPVIALASRVGSLLRLIPAPPEASPAPVEPVTAVTPAPRQVHPVRPSRRAAVAPSAPVTAGSEVVPAVPASAPPVSPPPEPVVQVPPQSTPPITLTAGDLIDLVLAAERTLRGVQGR